MPPIHRAVLQPTERAGGNRCAIVPVLALLAACQGLPPREEMLDIACADLPCRVATEIELIDAGGETRRFEVPAGPVYAGGILSLISGETQYLELETGDEQRLTARWIPEVRNPDKTLRARLEQVADEDGRRSQLALHNPLDYPLRLRIEQYPAGSDRFYPLPIAPLPPGRTVRRNWPHAILEVQITGLAIMPTPSADE
jgi:hypothetical protein